MLEIYLSIGLIPAVAATIGFFFCVVGYVTEKFITSNDYGSRMFARTGFKVLILGWLIAVIWPVAILYGLYRMAKDAF